MTKEEIIRQLALQAHPKEGGYFKRTYTAQASITQAGVARKIVSAIYYLLTQDHPYGFLHKNRSDILHFHHCGAAIQYITVNAKGHTQEATLGPALDQGEIPQLLVVGDTWKASHLCAGEYALISEVVAPGFEYSDNEIATLAQIQRQFPLHIDYLRPYIKASI